MKKIATIILSRFKKETEEDWVKERRDICRTCPYNSKNSEASSLKIKIIQVFSDLYSLITFSKDDLGKCNKCGCSLKYKTAMDFETCGLEEVGEEPKWTSIFIEPNRKKKPR